MLRVRLDAGLCDILVSDVRVKLCILRWDYS